MNINTIRHIVKELKNDYHFQISKIVFRIKMLISGCLNIKSSVQSIRSVKNCEIVIYTLGKSGSSSVYYTLMNKLPFKKIFHLHFLSDHWIKDTFPGTPHERNIHKADAYFKHISGTKKKKIKYITLVREPISRDISGFFQNYRLTNTKFDKNNLESIREIISSTGHELSTTWFDSDFYNYTGFDIFKEDFDIKKGYDIYSIDDNTEVLIILTHRLSEVFETAIFEYLNLKIDRLINFNVSSTKKDGSIINNLKQIYYEKDAFIDEIYSSKFVKHFFNADEIDAYKTKWKRKINK